MTVLLKRPEVRQRTTLSDSVLYRLMEKGQFPRPIQLNPNGRAVAWVESEVEQWIEQRIEAARQEKGVA